MKRREEARLMAELVQSSDSSSDSEEERKRKRHRKKGKRSKHGHKKRSVMAVRLFVCPSCVAIVGLLEYPNLLYRSKKRRKRVQDSSDSESEGGEEGVWVEKKIKRDNEDAFVGPVPEIRVQANVNKKEYVPNPLAELLSGF